MDLESRIKLSDPKSYYGTPFRFWIAKNSSQMIQSFCPIVNARILDLGCGQGQYSELFKSLNISGAYLGIDLNDRNNWDKIKDHDKDLEEILTPLISHLEEQSYKCKLVEIQGISVLTFFDRELN